MSYCCYGKKLNYVLIFESWILKIFMHVHISNIHVNDWIKCSVIVYGQQSTNAYFAEKV